MAVGATPKGFIDMDPCGVGRDQIIRGMSIAPGPSHGDAAEIREQLEIAEGDYAGAEVIKGTLVLRPVSAAGRQKGVAVDSRSPTIGALRGPGAATKPRRRSR